MKKILIVSGLLAMSVGVFFLLRLYEWKDMKRQIHSYLEERYSREQFVWEYPLGDYLVYWTSLHTPHFSDGGTYEFLSFYPIGHPEFTARMQCTQYGPFYDTYANIRDGYKKSEALKKRLFKAGERYAVALPADETGDINYLHFVVYYEATDTLVMKQFVNRCIGLLHEEQAQNAGWDSMCDLPIKLIWTASKLWIIRNFVVICPVWEIYTVGILGMGHPMTRLSPRFMWNGSKIDEMKLLAKKGI